MRILDKYSRNPLPEPKLLAEPVQTIGFNIEGGTPMNGKETISKRDQVASLIHIQISIIDKGL